MTDETHTFERMRTLPGRAPDTLLATRRDQSGATRTRPLCQYPQVARYKGSGSTDDAASFSCSSGF